MSQEAVDEHIEAFNDTVRTGDWAGFADRFGDDAELVFVGVPAGPFLGRASIEAAYHSNPPDDTMTRVGSPELEEGEEVVSFRWDRDGATGTMRFVWSPDGRIRRLTVHFD